MRTNKTLCSSNRNIILNTMVANKIKGGYSWTLVSRFADMLEKSSGIYGPRDTSYTVLRIEFEKNGPLIWYPFSSNYIAIQLSLNASNDFINGCYELAHESVHLLSPLGERGASVLEEGLATKFAVDYVKSEFGVDQKVNLPSYHNAYNLVCKLIALDESAIKKLREHEFVISKFTSELLMEHYPDIGQEVANELCSKFKRNAT